jgi:hypothetical protein
MMGSCLSGALSVLSIGLGLLWAGGAEAAGEGCSYRDLSEATRGRTREARIASIERKLRDCEGRLTNEELARGLGYLCDEYKSAPPDFEGCLRVTTRLVRLGEVQGYAQYNYDYGYCGGDCAKSPSPRNCEHGKEQRAKAVALEKHLDTAAKVGAEFQMEQPVPCALEAARKLVANMDKSAFYSLALRFMAKYEKQCAQATDSEVRVALANDKALVFFHRGDDAACLRVLGEVAPIAKASGATDFNRALCGGPCALDRGRCVKVQETRKHALLGRTKLAPSGTRLDDPACARANYTRRPTHLFAWDLKTYRVCEEGKCLSTKHPMTALGDLDGDGWGEYSNRTVEAHELRGDLGTVRQPYLVFRLFSNVDVCERGDFVEVATLSTGDLEQEQHPLAFEAKITAPANAASKLYCIYPSKGLKCSPLSCNVEPYSCADMTRGRK